MSTVETKTPEEKQNFFAEKLKQNKDLNATEVKADDVTQEVMNPHKYEQGDRVVYIERNQATPGTITDITQMEKALILEITPFNASKDPVNVRASNENLAPLFYVKDETKYPRQFAYEELAELFKKDAQGNNQIFNLNWEDIHNKNYDHSALMAGRKTSLVNNVQLDVESSEGKKYKIAINAKLLLRRRKSGKAYVSYDKQFQRLDLDKGVYGQPFTKEQRKQLEETNELGLIEYANPQTGELKNIWVSIDRELNKIVTLPENQVDISRIYNVNTTKQQQEALKKGEHIFIDFKDKTGKKIEMYAKVSAAASNGDGKVIMSKENAIKYKLVTDPEKKNKKSNGQKLK